MEFKVARAIARGITDYECSRTRLEFKDDNVTPIFHTIANAVAPDWNLKERFYNYYESNGWNAVAPDWNLKLGVTPGVSSRSSNAVAPDWNLKLSVKNLLTKDFNNAVAPDWNLKLINS